MAEQFSRLWQRLRMTAIGGSPVDDLLIATGVTLIVFILLYLVVRTLAARLEAWAARTSNKFDDAVMRLLGTMSLPVCLVIAVFIGSQWLTLHPFLRRVIDLLFLIVATIEAVHMLQYVLLYILRRFWKRGSQDVTELWAPATLAVRVVLWATALLFVLSNMGINITALIASLGIGGIAIAFALQNILEDLFSSFSIYFDEPFRVGDFIVTGQHMGTVKKVGLKTTRIQALQGEEIVIANKELTTSRVQNFKRMQRRRIQFSFGIALTTPPDKLQRVQEIVKEIIASIPRTELERAHFKAIQPTQFEYEAAYYVLSDEYSIYMDIQQMMNIELLQRLQSEGIALALPVQEVRMTGVSERRS